MCVLYAFCFILLVQQSTYTFGYTIPKPKIEVLSPRGFKLTIPEDPNDVGIVFIAFHGKINTEFIGTESGDFSGEAKSDGNGNWIYENKKQLLEPGSTLYYWIHLQHKQLGYRVDNQKFVVEDNNRQSTSTRNPIRATTRSTTTERTIPDYREPTFRPTVQPTRLPPTPRPRPTSPCNPSITTVKGKQACSGELIFEEDFSELNLNKWKHQVKISLDSKDAEFVSYQDYSDICYTSKGNLIVAPKLLTDMPGFTRERVKSGELDLGSKCTEIGTLLNEGCHRRAESFRILPPVVSCKLRTKDFFSFKYGKIEIRAKLPKGDWMFPQLFLDPADNFYGSKSYSSGQLRVAFIRSNEILSSKDFEPIGGNRVSGGAVLSNGEDLRDTWLKSVLQQDHLGNEYHTYSMTWTNQEITLSLDNVPYGTLGGGFKELVSSYNITGSSQWRTGDFMAPFDREFYISLGIGVGGVSDFPDGCRSGTINVLKPWGNTSPKAELKFWNDVNTWYSTWNKFNYKLQIDYVKVWAI